MYRTVSRVRRPSIRTTVSKNETIVKDFMSNLWKVERLDGLTDAQILALHAHLEDMIEELDNSTIETENFKASRDIPDLVDGLRPQIQRPISEIKQSILTSFPGWISPGDEDENADTLMQLLFKLWLFLPIRLKPVKAVSAPADYGLKDAILALLPDTTTPFIIDHSNLLSEDFCEQSLTRKGNFEIVPTSDLSLHLTFREGQRRQLFIFRHARLLEHLITTPHEESELFPAGFLQETLNTIYLLFPIKKYGIRRRVRRYGAKRWVADVEAHISQYEYLDLKRYPFYNQRLVEVQRRYNNSRPRRLSQLWFDDRNPAERLTLLVALVVFVLTVVFGLTQSVTGVLQVIK